MSRAMIRAGCFAAGLLLSSTVAQAQKPEQAKGGKHEAGTEAASTATGIFTSAERRTISDYFAHHPYTPKPLPPGIAKKIARGGTLPPGIAKRYLPQNLLVQLPARPGYQWVVVDNDVVLIVAATGLIADILSDVL